MFLLFKYNLKNEFDEDILENIGKYICGGFMRKLPNGIDEIKNKIHELKGVSVDLEVNTGRKKIKTFSGIIQSVYPSVFTFQDNDGNTKTYSYSDVLCGDVKIM